MNLRLILAGATVGGAVSLGPLLLGTAGAAADPAVPQLPAEQAAASDPATSDDDSQSEEQQAEPVHDNWLAWDVPAPVQVTVPVGVSLGLPSIPIGLPEVPLPEVPLPEVPLPEVPLPPAPF